MTPLACGNGLLSLRCGDLLYFPKNHTIRVPLETWPKHEAVLHEWSTWCENSYVVYAFFPLHSTFVNGLKHPIITSGTNLSA